MKHFICKADAAALAEDDSRFSPVKRLRGGGYDEEEDDMIDEDGALYNEDDDPIFHDDWANGALEDDLVVEQDLFLEEVPSKWSRPPVDPNFSSSKDDLHFQWIDMDMTVGPPLSENPNAEKKERIEGVSNNPLVPILRIYGVNDEGNSVAAFVHGFTPYGYFAIPQDSPLIAASSSKRQRYLEDIRSALNNRLKQSSSRGGDPFKGSVSGSNDEPTYCVGCTLITNHKSIMGFETSHQQFLKVLVALPTMIPTLKRIMEEGIILPGLAANTPTTGIMDEHGAGFAPFECNVPFILRYMIDHGITGSSWITLPSRKYRIRENAQKQSHAQIEVDVTHNDVIAHKPEGEWNKIAPFRVLSVDIECQGRKGHFPEAQLDPVIQIANVVCVYGTPKPIIQNVFTLKGCLPIVGAQVLCSDTEGEMLLKWRAFLQASDADIITGYNVQNFDIPYLLDRADALLKQTKSKNLHLFKMWGRIKNQPAKMKDTTFQSAAYGKRNNVETTIEGRVVFDMLPYMQRNYKLSSYSLNSVCAEYLGQQKEDVHHSIISDLQNGSDEDRHRLAVYCLKDAQLPLRLMEKMSVLVNYIEMARVTGVPIEFLIARGQQIKVLSMLLRKCRDIGLLIPTLSKKGGGGEDTTYEGATVLDPIKAYYQVPIATLDFASLYPSIMQAYNLCYSTLVSPCDVHKLSPDKYDKSDNGHVFVKSSVKIGILPTILGVCRVEDDVCSALKKLIKAN